MNVLQLNREIYLSFENSTWIAEIATPKMSINIDLEVARRLGGVSLESVPATTYGYILACKTLDVVTKKVPTEFRLYPSFEDYPDPDLVADLFRQYEEKASAFRAELKKNRDQKLHSSASGNHSGSIPDSKIPDPTKRNKKPRRSVRRAEELPFGSERNHGGFQPISRNPADHIGDERNGENGSDEFHPRENPAFTSGRGRVFERRPY